MAKARNISFDLDSVLYELQRLKFPAHKWRLLANSLRAASVVDNIDADHRDVAGKLQAVISHWVKSTTQHNQWITLVEAVIMCDECGVAEQLATAVGVEYIHPQLTTGLKRPHIPDDNFVRDLKQPAKRTIKQIIIKQSPKQTMPSVEQLSKQAAQQHSSKKDEANQDALIAYIERLKQKYQDPPLTWGPLPQCGHIKPAMIREKGKRRGKANEVIIKHKMKGDIEAIVKASKKPVEVDKVFERGLFEKERRVILVEGPSGGGKTSLTYHYSQEWAAGNLSMFDVVAVVHLRDLVVTPATTLHDLLLLACANKHNFTTKKMIQKVVEYNPRILLLLDGWDELPSILRKSSFVTDILQFISPESKILITSRPDSSVDLHGLANRLEILGFTEKNIHEYFLRALSTELDHDEVEDGCRKLREHFHNHPVIKSCCSNPLNAAILAHLFLTDQTLPSTRHELFHIVVVNCIYRELKNRHSLPSDVTISSLDDLPREYKIVLDHICVLAFEGVKQNKVVFPQEELVRLKLPIDLPDLGVLQIYESFNKTGQKTFNRYFIHLSIQDLLAAYHISHLREDEQLQVFHEMLNGPRFSAVLQFYAAFTGLTNQGVQNVITTIKHSKLTMLTFVQCFFEAQFYDQLLHQHIVSELNGKLDFSDITMTPFDCICLGYFLASVLRAVKHIIVILRDCSIDEHSLGLLMGELSKHAEACPAVSVLEGVTELHICGNEIKDNGMAHVANSLQANTTMKQLIACECGISDKGIQSLAAALAGNSAICLEYLNISCNKIGDDGITAIANVLNSIKFLSFGNNFLEISEKGAESLAKELATNSSLVDLDLLETEIGENGIAHIATALQSNNTLKSLAVGAENMVDEEIVTLANSLTTNTSLEYMWLTWSSTHPDNTLRKMAESVRKSTLRRLRLHVHIALPSADEVLVSGKDVKEWFEQVEVGGRELILSLEDSRLEELELLLFTWTEPAIFDTKQTITSLQAAAKSVNSARSYKKLTPITFLFEN